MKEPYVHLQNFGPVKSEKVGDGIYLSVKSLVMEPRKSYALVSASGRGKTVLLSTLAGFPPTQWLNGRSISDDSQYSWLGKGLTHVDFCSPQGFQNAIKEISPSQVIYMPQHLPSNRAEEQTVEEAMSHVLLAAHSDLPRSVARNEVKMRLREVSLDYTLKKKLYQLSGGERRRVELVVRLHSLTLASIKNKDASLPAIILLDEPTTGLDLRSSCKFFEAICSLGKTTEVPLLVATHSLEQVNEERFDEIVLLDRDDPKDSSPMNYENRICRVVFQGKIDAMFNHFNVGNRHWEGIIELMNREPSKSLEDEFVKYLKAVTSQKVYP